MNPTNIEWCTHTLNPVTGCLRGCSMITHGFDCYACKLHTKRHQAYLNGKKLSKRYQYPFNEIHYWPDTFDTVPKNPKKPIKLFIGSMSDICYWTPYYIQETIDFCQSRPNIEFMFLTKGGGFYTNWAFPGNCWLGLTITKNDNENTEQYSSFLNLDNGNRRFISIEPLLGVIGHISKEIKLVIVGADTSDNAVPPEKSWIESIKHHNIFYKSNIRKYL